jgi:cytochrome c oxidase subunit 2
VLLIVFFAVYYRRGHKVDRSNPPEENLTIEIIWTTIPGLLVMATFIWATSVYFINQRAPAGAMEVYVVGKQWMWKLQHPSGRWEMNQLHVPVGKPVRLIMTSEDVIHSFYVPAFRVKQDVVPGRYSTLWFEPTKVGQYHLFCAEYCGTKHSGMVGSVFVMEPADYEKWLRTGNVPGSMASKGEQLFRELGCSGCHGGNSSVRAPLLDGLYNRPVAIEAPDGSTRTLIADERYIRDSVLLPEAEVAAGYKPIMPTFKGKISEEDLLQIMEYIKSLSTSNGTSNGSARDYVPPAGARPQANDNTPLASPPNAITHDPNVPLASPQKDFSGAR